LPHIFDDQAPTSFFLFALRPYQDSVKLGDFYTPPTNFLLFVVNTTAALVGISSSGSLKLPFSSPQKVRLQQNPAKLF
jgi:hypothetical protein